MIIVIQCAKKKVTYAPTMILNTRVVHFVARPQDSQIEKRPWDQIPGSNKTWIDFIKAYNEADGVMPSEYHTLNVRIEAGRQLTRCGNLYKHPVYSELISAYGLRSVYILSAGWGLVRADKFIPNYNVTFSKLGDICGRISGADRCQYAYISDKIPDNGQINLFISQAYVPYWSHLYQGAAHRTVLHWRFGQELPAAQYVQDVKVEPHNLGNLFTNWQYKAARQFISGLKPTAKAC